MHHAQRDTKTGTVQENPLTEFGRIEAENLGKMLKEAQVSAIYTGEYIRYAQTVELINKYIQAPVIIDKKLNEWVSNIEDRKSFQKRTHEFLKELIAKHKEEDMIFCVTSGVNLQEFVTFFNRCKPLKGFQIMQAVGVCPITFHYKK